MSQIAKGQLLNCASGGNHMFTSSHITSQATCVARKQVAGNICTMDCTSVYDCRLTWTPLIVLMR